MLSIVIACITIISLIICILKFPVIKVKNFKIESFWVVSVVGAILILVTNTLPISELMIVLSSNDSINPIKVLILLLSISFLSITLDELGFFSFLATKAMKLVKNSQYKLFIILYILIAILTMFTSNDIIILTFTLFICYFARETKINPIPYLVMEFIVANTYSMIFIIGNPTNIYIATAYGISFGEYFKVMALPTITAGIFSFFILLLLFKKMLKKPFSFDHIEEKKPKNIPLTIISLIHLFATMIILAISKYIDMEMWIVSFISATSLLLFTIVYSVYKNDSFTINIIKRLPWNLIVFVLSMFTIVLSLKYNNVFHNLSLLFNNIIANSKLKAILTYGIASTLSDNLINNIPMSLAYTAILADISKANLIPALYATIIGSNIGAFLTPIGALAGIMWMKILKEQNVKFSFALFTKYGLLLTTTLLFVSLFSLYFVV